MIRTILILVILLLTIESGIAQSFSVGAGINYGGALPTEKVDSTSGKPLIGLNTGIAYTIPLSKRFSFTPALYYSFRGLDYGQNFTRDTLFAININGVSAEVPSYYTAFVNGSMRLHYINMPLLFSYRIFKFNITFGPYLSVLVSGKDAGDVRVVIGEGGILDDYMESFDNFSVIRKLEQGFIIGSQTPIYKNLNLEMKVSRSLFTLYHPDRVIDNGQGIVKMYNTYMEIGLVYQFKSEKLLALCK